MDDPDARLEKELNLVLVKSVQSIIPGFDKLSLNKPCNHLTSTPKKLTPLDRLRRTLHLGNRKKENTCTSSTRNGINANKPLQWQDDEKSVRVGTCSFNVTYLGSIEVRESRGMDVCEQAIQALLNQKIKHIKAVLHISGDALRVVDETNKGLIVDQTIEKVSFCAPGRHHEKSFAYICRDGATRRWLCHGFLAIKKTGERLSHAVGCAFQICLERKQKRDQECNVTVEYTQNGTSFTRFGSFRTTSITERIIDPQSALVAEPIPYTSANQKDNVIERPRPKGNDFDAFNRSVSMRSGDLHQTTTNAFKRQSSLRSSDLPSIQKTKYKDSLANTIPEEVEVISTTNEFSKVSLFDSTNTISHDHFSFPSRKSSIISLPSTTNNENTSSNFWLTNSQSTISQHVQHTKPATTMSINDAFNSNLSALVQSNHPVNPFSPYGYSMAAQAQSPDTKSRQSSIFTPKRSTNPFDDDLIRR